MLNEWSGMVSHQSPRNKLLALPIWTFGTYALGMENHDIRANHFGFYMPDLFCPRTSKWHMPLEHTSKLYCLHRAFNHGNAFKCEREFAHYMLDGVV